MLKLMCLTAAVLILLPHSSTAAEGWLQLRDDYKKVLFGGALVQKDIPKIEMAFPLRNRDRIVLIGGTLIEREQRYGYWETALTNAYPGASFVVRNLGWSGDTVFGDSRAGFDTPKEGFQRLVEHVKALKPTVILVAYGSNEALDEKRPSFEFAAGLDRLLDALASTKARIALIAPPPHEEMGHPYPSAAKANEKLRSCSMWMLSAAVGRSLQWIELVPAETRLDSTSKKPHLTDNGVHFSPFGYWQTAVTFRKAVERDLIPWQVSVDAANGKIESKGTSSTDCRTGPLRFCLADDELPLCNPPSDSKVSFDGNQRRLRITKLPPGKHTLKIDGHKVATATAVEWAAGVVIRRGPEFDQVEKLRAAIIAKNQLYFYRWRPQNETYLFGFRKHEQGQNAKEVVLFDPLVDQEEKKIAELRRPVTHQYEITPATEGK